MKFSAVVFRLVKLHRPPPEIAIFLPIRSACSSTTTLRPRLPASIAQSRPAAPPPITTTSFSWTRKTNHLLAADVGHEDKGLHRADLADEIHSARGHKKKAANTLVCRPVLPTFTAVVLWLSTVRLWGVVNRTSLNDIFLVIIHTVPVYVHTDFELVLLSVAHVAGVKR